MKDQRGAEFPKHLGAEGGGGFDKPWVAGWRRGRPDSMSTVSNCYQ